MNPTLIRALVLLCSIAVIGSAFMTSASVARAQEGPSNVLVYHQLTNRTEGTRSLGTPIISGDGMTAAYAESAAQALDPQHPARIYVIDATKGGTVMYDSYEALCFCQSWVDISTRHVVSTDTVQIRIGGSPFGRQLLKLDSNEISGFKITGDGSQIFFTIRRDVSMNGGKKTLTQGVYAIPTSGGAPRQVVGVDAIAAALNIPVSRLPNVLHYDANPNLLDVTTDGGLVAFAATAGPAREYLLTVPGGGGTPEVIAGPYSVMTHAAVSGDGTTLAWGMVRNQSYDMGVLGNGKATAEFLEIYNETYQPLQLSNDGKWLLVGTDGSLYDTDTLVSRPLATPANSQARADTLLSRGMDRASMSSDGKRFLYVLKDIPSNAFEQMATVEIGPEPSGNAPLIKGVRVGPATITTVGSSSPRAVPTIDIVWDGELVSFGYVPSTPARSTRTSAAARRSRAPRRVGLTRKAARESSPMTGSGTPNPSYETRTLALARFAFSQRSRLLTVASMSRPSILAR
jgi:hypothetical protein